MTALFLLLNDVITDHKSTPINPLILPLSVSLLFCILFALSVMICADNNSDLHFKCFVPRHINNTQNI